MYLLMASREYIHSQSSGAIHKTVYVPTVKELRVCVPAIEEQKRLAEVLRSRISATESVALSAEQQLNLIDATPACLLRAAFSGQL
jgi:type I restriction enzyme S subunit